MHVRRTIKQWVYASMFFGFVIGFGALVFVIVRGPSVPEIPLTVSPPSYAPVEVEDVSIVRQGDAVDLVARLRNPNARAGMVEYPVTFILRDAQDREIQRETVVSYLLPGSVQYAVVLSVVPERPVVRVELEYEELPAFGQVPGSLTLPAFGTLLQDRERLQRGDQVIEQQIGLVTNNSTFDFQRVEVVAVALDATGRTVGVGKTFVGALTVGEQRQFTIQWPAPAVATSEVILLPTTNIFKEENVLRAIGDPGQLR